MKGEIFNISAHKTRVLVVPLDWGLGHATRCIPLINELLHQNCDVIIGAERITKTLLEKEFPKLSFLPIRGYRIRYSRSGLGFPIKILLQLPKILSVIYSEHRWLNKIIKQHAIDLVISDNRLGLYNPLVPCIYITHQLTIKTGNRFTEWIAQKFHYHFINKYNNCWVPDSIDEPNLAGELSHPGRLPKIPVQYLGPLSRFKKSELKKKYSVAFIISGPEPQRTVFEGLMMQELEHYKGSCIMVRGVYINETGLSKNYRDTNNRIEIHDHLSSIELNKVIQESELVISRSGYTTVMDLIKLQQKAILIPTPGQTEQEYLAKSLMKKKIFYTAHQTGFSLTETLKKITDFSFDHLSIEQGEYKNVIGKLIHDLK